MELLRKLSTKTVLGDRPDRPKDKKTVSLYSVYGIANGVQTGESDYGSWSKLKGSFEAVRISDGEVFQSGACILPEPVNSMISAELQQVDNDGKRVTQSVQFSFEVGVKRTETAIGYEYVATTLVESGGADPLAALRKETAKALPSK